MNPRKFNSSEFREKLEQCYAYSKSKKNNVAEFLSLVNRTAEEYFQELTSDKPKPTGPTQNKLF